MQWLDGLCMSMNTRLGQPYEECSLPISMVNEGAEPMEVSMMGIVKLLVESNSGSRRERERKLMEENQ